jgi:hypothetical protein
MTGQTDGLKGTSKNWFFDPLCPSDLITGERTGAKRVDFEGFRTGPVVFRPLAGCSGGFQAGAGVGPLPLDLIR